MENEQIQTPLDALHDIRNMMNSSLRFHHLSGKAGIVVGILALLTVALTYFLLGISVTNPGYANNIFQGSNLTAIEVQLISLYFTLLLIAIWVGFSFASKNARKHQLTFWTPASAKLIKYMAIPLVSGGLLCCIFLFHHQPAWLAPITLIFYGLALINGSKHTLQDVFSLGMLEIITGLLAACFLDYGLLFWAFGMGVLHIYYGFQLYRKYEK
ncbi:MAG: hypothetical protein EBX50_00470 [Chitinophagia bacterium]|nr:hypothetical protein [Chitinophagia bacterium]